MGVFEAGHGPRRALRRHHRLMLILRARSSLKLSWLSESDREHLALRQFGQLKTCSCWMCGNPRKFTGERTIQERRRLVRIDGEGDESFRGRG